MRAIKKEWIGAFFSSGKEYIKFNQWWDHFCFFARLSLALECRSVEKNRACFRTPLNCLLAIFNSRLIVLLHVYLAAILYVTAREFNSFRYESSKVSSAFRRINALCSDSLSCILHRRDQHLIGLSSTRVQFSLGKKQDAALDLRGCLWTKGHRGIPFNCDRRNYSARARARERERRFIKFVIKL